MLRHMVSHARNHNSRQSCHAHILQYAEASVNLNYGNAYDIPGIKSRNKANELS